MTPNEYWKDIPSPRPTSCWVLLTFYTAKVCCWLSILPRHAAGLYSACCILGCPSPLLMICPQSVSSQRTVLHSFPDAGVFTCPTLHRVPVNPFLQFIRVTLSSSLSTASPPSMASSASLTGVHSFCRSLIKTLNGRHLCGTPVATGTQAEYAPLAAILWAKISDHVFIHLLANLPRS